MTESSVQVAEPPPTPLLVDTSHPIVLATLNARFIHSAFGLRYLKANLAEHQACCEIAEFTIDSRPEDIVEKILSKQPSVVGFGVYIWNTVQTERVIALLKALAPDLVVVLGGPEVSYEFENQSIVKLADFVITGWGDVSFKELIDALAAGEPAAKIIVGKQARLRDIALPYDLYTDDDIANRVLYVEASRGCPFKCEFCLSALDKTAWPFDLDLFLTEMAKLHARGARHFKFVDRTFNLKVKSSLQILAFFLERLSDDLFLHFEVVPDHLPTELKQMIQRFPAGSLQFEIGIQTFNPQVQQAISRRQKNEVAEQNLHWIRNHSHAYIHADLIFGLPGESLASFERSFNRLYALRPHEIQVGVLKRLKGSPIVRHTQTYALVFDPNPPFAIVSNDEVSFSQVQSMKRFARYWDLIANSGRFVAALPLLLVQPSDDAGNQGAFGRFRILSDALFTRTGQTHKIALTRLFDLIFEIGQDELSLDQCLLSQALERDFARSGLRSLPKFLQHRPKQNRAGVDKSRVLKAAHKARQARHL